MLSGLTKAVAQLGDPRMRGIIWRALGVALVIFLALWGLCWWGIDYAGTAFADYLAQEGFWNDALEWLIGLGGVAAVLVASFLLFPAVMGLGLSFFLEDAATVVEARHYPALPPAEEQPVHEALLDGINLAAVTIAINLIALPVYLILSILPPLNLIVFYAVNGYLLGREYFELVAVRRLERPEVRRLRGLYRARVILAGVGIAIMLTIPVLNLFAPVVATAFMVHVFEGIRRKAGAGPARAA